MKSLSWPVRKVLPVFAFILVLAVGLIGMGKFLQPHQADESTTGTAEAAIILPDQQDEPAAPPIDEPSIAKTEFVKTDPAFKPFPSRLPDKIGEAKRIGLSNVYKLEQSLLDPARLVLPERTLMEMGDLGIKVRNISEVENKVFITVDPAPFDLPATISGRYERPSCALLANTVIEDFSADRVGSNIYLLNNISLEKFAPFLESLGLRVTGGYYRGNGYSYTFIDR